MFMYNIKKRGFIKMVTLRMMNAEYPWFCSHPKIWFLETSTSVTINQSTRPRVTKYFGIHYYDSTQDQISQCLIN